MGIKYLGLPIMLGSNRNHVWEDVISKFKKKIAAWGGFWLSTGDKLTLIKFVLSALYLSNEPGFASFEISVRKVEFMPPPTFAFLMKP